MGADYNPLPCGLGGPAGMAYTRQTMDRSPALALFCCALLTAACPALAQSGREQARAELDLVTSRIDALQKEMEKAGRRRSRAEKALAAIEQEEQGARRELVKLRGQLERTRKRQAELERQLARQERELANQRASLSQQLKVAYINGDEEWMRVVLSQQDVTELGRQMTYYTYLNQQRTKTIDALRRIIVELEDTRESIEREARELLRLERSAADQLEDIADTRAERARLVARINEEIAGKDAELERLQSQAAELSELVNALADVLPEMPDVDAEPFAGQTAQLTWPADGPLLRKFGDSRADGRMKWQGVLLGAAAGSDVRSVYHGRVVFSDWLDGMGLLLIIEHGDGYMSLYGHNQDLMRDVGEWVEPGDLIAHVGDSGGKAAAGLYFEIRRNGEPVNPGKWIR